MAHPKSLAESANKRKKYICTRTYPRGRARISGGNPPFHRVSPRTYPRGPDRKTTETRRSRRGRNSASALWLPNWDSTLAWFLLALGERVLARGSGIATQGIIAKASSTPSRTPWHLMRGELRLSPLSFCGKLHPIRKRPAAGTLAAPCSENLTRRGAAGTAFCVKARPR